MIDQHLADVAIADQHRLDRPCGASAEALERRARRSPAQASAVSGVFSDGFQTTALPQTSASAAFHDQTATGKLNAESDLPWDTIFSQGRG